MMIFVKMNDMVAKKIIDIHGQTKSGETGDSPLP